MRSLRTTPRYMEQIEALFLCPDDMVDPTEPTYYGDTLSDADFHQHCVETLEQMAVDAGYELDVLWLAALDNEVVWLALILEVDIQARFMEGVGHRLNVQAGRCSWQN
jgi:hypothetical protein